MGDLHEIYERLEARDPAPADYACERCEDSGWIIAGDGHGSATPCPCRKPEPPTVTAVLRRLAPPAYQDYTRESYPGEIPTAVDAWGADPHGVLYLYGRQGRGKTHVATATFAELVAGGRSGAWCDCLSLIKFCQRHQEQAGAEEERLERVEILLLDDFHLTRTDYARELLDNLIRARDLSRLPTMVTAQPSLRDMVGERDPAVLSRMRGHEVEITGPDWRGRG